MITKNDLYDISAAFIRVRSDITAHENVPVLTQIESVLVNELDNCEDNQIRKALSTINNLDKNKWHYIYCNNVYVNHQAINNKNIYDLLIFLCCSLKELIQNNNYEQAYDLVDCIHALPEILANNNIKIPSSYWKTYVKTYQKKWDKSFLRKHRLQIRS